jgi:uncharacterized protein (TIGR03083 family)
MDVAGYLQAFSREGELFAAAAACVSPDTPIPTCPDWVMRDLVIHLGHVHRWARTYVTSGRQDMLTDAEEAELFSTPPDDRSLLPWFRDGHAALAAAFTAAPADLACWTFLRAPTPLTFWARRQTHETGIHRVDAESPTGSCSPFPLEVAVDGIEELLFEFGAGRSRQPDVGGPLTLYIHAEDAQQSWLVTMRPDSVEASRAAGTPTTTDCTVTSTAAQLYLLLWNRRPLAGLTYTGDPAVVEAWARSIRIRWS